MAKRPKRPGPQSRELTDPRAIRALAHPARLAVLDALAGGVELTATACAQIAGISPSAMSYHLRALEKWGLVERVESSDDARERPWRAYPGGFSITTLPDAATVAATSMVTNRLLTRLASELDALFEREHGEPHQWQSVAGVEDSRTWLTADEVQELQDLHRGFLDARRQRTAADRPAEARLVRVARMTIPAPGDGADGPRH